MTRASLMVLAAVAAVHPLSSQEPARPFDPLPGGGQVYTVDAAHSILDFTVRLVGFNRVRGSFTDWGADLFYDPAEPSHSSLDFVARVASVATGVEERDTDLKRPNFFDAARFPEMRFHSTRATPSAGGISIEGVLTIRDSSRPVRFEARVLEPMGVDPFGNWRISFGASVTLNRRDFGVIGPDFWNHAISDSVTVEMEIGARLWDYFNLGWGSKSRRSIGQLLFNAADSGQLSRGLATARTLVADPTDTTINASAWEFEKAAMRRVQMHHLDDARRILEFARETLRTAPSGDRAEVLARLGEVYLRMGRRADAQSALRDAVAADPDNTLALQLRLRAQ
ncbi:MAG TPA: YceI family protein [Gemmatimonadales bacterium]|nr:YceI family protein [Gemmatimonadales bacterium]